MDETEDMEAEMDFDDGEEPSFSDPEDFEDDFSDQGKRKEESSRLSGLVHRTITRTVSRSYWLADGSHIASGINRLSLAITYKRIGHILLIAELRMNRSWHLTHICKELKPNSCNCEVVSVPST